MKFTTTSNGVLADQYGHLLAQQSELAKKVKKLKEQMLKSNSREFNGTHFRVTISVQTDRLGFDAEAAKAMLGPKKAALCMKPLADATRFNVRAVMADTSVSA